MEKIRIDPAAYGFLDLAAVPADEASGIREDFRRYLELGYNAGMSFLEKNIDKRMDPALLVEDASTIICFLAPYGPAAGGVAGFAQGEDYHSAVKRRLFRVMESLEARAASLGLPGFKGRAFVDSAPVLERFWAARAGLGFIGRNGFLISPEFGLRTIIGEIICNVPFTCFEPHAPLGVTSCGDCGRCRESCPSGALKWQEGGRTSLVDSRLCVSYHTIESKVTGQEHPVDFSGWLFGCERCLSVCPWDKPVKPWEELSYNADYLVNLGRECWFRMPQEEFDEKFADSGLKRAGLEKIKDNL